MTYAATHLMSFEELLAVIDRYVQGVRYLPASVDRDDWAQEARLAAWSLTASGSVNAEFSAVLKATGAAIRHHRQDAVHHAVSCSMKSLNSGEEQSDADHWAFGTVASAEAEAIAYETFFAVSRKKRNRNGVPSCRFRQPGVVPCEN